MTGALASLRRGGLVVALLRAAPGTALLVAAVVCLASFVLAGGALWFGRAADAALPALLEAMPAGQRGLEFERYGTILPGDGDPIAGVTAAGDAIEHSLPPGVAGIAGERVGLVDSAEYQALDPPVLISRMSLRIQPWAEGAIRYVDGVPPTGRVTTQPTRDRSVGGDTSGVMVDSTVVEVAISSETSRVLEVGVGDRLVMVPATSRHGTLVVAIVGVFDIVDPSDPRWFSDTSLATPFREQFSMDIFIYHAIALLSPDAYPVLALDGTIGQAPLRYRWRFQVEPARAASGDAERAVADLSTLQAAYPYRGSSGVASDTPGLTSGVFGVVAQYRLQRRTAGTAFALAAIGPLAAGIGLLALAAAALARRRAPAARLLRARGASRTQVVGAELATAAALSAIPALLGAAGASLATLGRVEPGAVLAAAGAVALAAAVLLVAAGIAALRRAATARASERGGLTGTSPRRLVVEALVVTVAVAGAMSLGSGGHAVAGVGTDPASGDVDPFVAAVPVLLALAGGLVLLRLFGAVVAALGWLSAHARGFSGVHAFRGLARGASRLDLPFVVVVVAVAAGVFSTSVAATLERTQAQAAAAAVGADYRIGAAGNGTFPSGFDVGALGAIGPVAVATTAGGSLSSATLAARPVAVIALDGPAYADVVRGTPAEGTFVADLTAASSAGAGAPGEPVPLLVPSSLASVAALAPGSALSVAVGDAHLDAVVQAVEADLPGFDRDTVVVPLGALRRALPGVSWPATAVFVRASPDARPAIEAVIAPYGIQLALRSSDAIERGLRDAALVGTMRGGFVAALVVAAVFAAVVVGAAFAQALALRTREVALLRALGLPVRGAVAVVVAELAVTVGVGAAAGLALGLGIARVTVPSLGVERFAGTAVAAAATVDPAGVIGALAGPLVAILAVTIPIVAAVRAADVSATLRAGEA